ncbi:hypothetical protein MA16_Dca023127 [Dendrobium catenatum]|uniref:Uncharacterized protein n=1 Tax=Dendrobium catenatum TaxID=906689 RepID=A0A2I0VEU7_9ASPA|nr:hypothetical protein MA16_Dca023127 [Dendrobium catenatum]
MFLTILKDFELIVQDDVLSSWTIRTNKSFNRPNSSRSSWLIELNLYWSYRMICRSSWTIYIGASKRSRVLYLTGVGGKEVCTGFSALLVDFLNHIKLDRALVNEKCDMTENRSKEASSPVEEGNASNWYQRGFRGMTAKKVDALEDEVEQIKSGMEEKFSTIEERFLTMEGSFSIMEN